MTYYSSCKVAKTKKKKKKGLHVGEYAAKKDS